MIRMPWFYGWNVVALTILYQAVLIGLTIYCYPFIAVSWIEEFGASRRDVMFSITAATIMMGFAAPLAGGALDRYSPRLLIGGGAVAYAVGLFLAARATSQWQIALIHASLIPTGLALTGMLSAQWLVTRWFEEKRGLALGISAIGTSVGGLGLPPLVTPLLASIGWRQTFDLFVAITLFVVLPLIYLVLSVNPTHYLNTPDDASSSKTFGSRAPLWTARTIISNRNFWILIAVSIPVGIFYSGTQYHLGAFAKDIGVPQEQAAWVVSFLSVVMICSKILMGRLADRYDLRLLCVVMLGFAVLAVGGFAIASSLSGLFLAGLCIGIANGGYLPVTGAVVSTRFGTASFGQVIGTLMVFASLGSLGAIVTGWIRESSGSYPVAFLSLVVVAVPGLLSFRHLQDKAVPRQVPAASVS